MAHFVQRIERMARWLSAHPVVLAAMAVLTAIVFRHPHAALFALGAINLDDVNTVTTKEISPGVVDGYFRAGPVVALCKKRFTRKWVGPQIQENFLAR